MTDLAELQALLATHSGADDEAAMVTLVQQMPATTLDTLVSGPDLARLLYSVDDRLLGADNRTRLLQVLTQDRLADLSLQARANLLHELQKGRTDHAESLAMEAIILGTTGESLTTLKHRLNAFNDRHDLEALLFVDLKDPLRRRRVLDHIATQAGGRVVGSKVLSDIDDTVFCQLHDHRYPKGTLYPGVLAFQEALDRGPDNTEATGTDLTFVTARPADFFGMVESHSRASLRKAGIKDLSMLSGSLFTLVSLDAMAGKKVDNITHWIELFPEYRMVFMGDSGQGDVLVGEKVWEIHGDVMDAVFIHDVVNTPDDVRADHASRKVVFHDTYVGAANTALQLGLISRTSRDEVCAEALRALDEIAWHDAVQEQAMRALFQRDVDAT